MTVETVTYISDLDATYPAESETGTLHEGNNHIRNIKAALKNTFPNLSAAVTASAVELNYLDGVSSNIQAQINAKSDATHDHDGDTLGAVTLGNGSVATTQALGDNTAKVATTAFVASALAALSASAMAPAWQTVTVATASATTEISFTTALDGSLYDHYQIIIEDLNTAASAVLQLQVIEASSAMATASAYTWGVQELTGQPSSASASFIPLGAKNISAQAMVLDVNALHITAQPTCAVWQWTSGKKPALRVGGASRNVAAAGDGLLFKASTGNMSGTFIVLGRKT